MQGFERRRGGYSALLGRGGHLLGGESALRSRGGHLLGGESALLGRERSLSCCRRKGLVLRSDDAARILGIGGPDEIVLFVAVLAGAPNQYLPTHPPLDPPSDNRPRFTDFRSAAS